MSGRGVTIRDDFVTLGRMNDWRKSSYSNSGACVEAGNGPGVIAVRDSAAEASPVLEFPAGAWTRFAATLKDAPGRSRTTPDNAERWRRRQLRDVLPRLPVDGPENGTHADPVGAGQFRWT